MMVSLCKMTDEAPLWCALSVLTGKQPQK